MLCLLNKTGLPYVTKLSSLTFYNYLTIISFYPHYSEFIGVNQMKLEEKCHQQHPPNRGRYAAKIHEPLIKEPRHFARIRCNLI